MPTQIGVNRIYSSLDEKTDSRKVTCKNCRTVSVPRGIVDTGKNALGKQEKHCPNCGHIHGRKNH